jgi:hypothetical protein
MSRTCLLLLLFHGGCPALLAEAKPWQEEVRPRPAGVSLGSDNAGYLHPCLTDLGATSPICKAAEATHQKHRKIFNKYFVKFYQFRNVLLDFG